MSVTQVHVAIIRHVRDVTVDNFVSENYVDGELETLYATGISKKLAILPLDRRDLQFLESGVYTFQDKKIYEVGATGTINDKSILYFDDKRFLIEGGTERTFEGGFTTYLGRRLSDSV